MWGAAVCQSREALIWRKKKRGGFGGIKPLSCLAARRSWGHIPSQSGPFCAQVVYFFFYSSAWSWKTCNLHDVATELPLAMNLKCIWLFIFMCHPCDELTTYRWKKLKPQFFRGWKKLFFLKEIHQFLLHENSIIEIAAAVWEIDDSNHQRSCIQYSAY